MDMKPTPALTEAHLDHGLPLLADLDLPLLLRAFQRALPATPAGPEGQEPEVQPAAPTFDAETVQDLVRALKGIGERKALRRLILVATSTGEELFRYETDKAAEAEALKAIALANPMEGWAAILGFLRASGLFAKVSPGSSSETKTEDQEAGTLGLPSDSPSGG